MKKLFYSFAFMATILLVTSCSGAKDVAYFKNIDNVDMSTTRGLYDAKIMPKDMLNINVNTTEPEASRPFNLTANYNNGNSNSSSMIGESYGSGAGNYQIGYLVDNAGNINFPVLGKLHVVGLTKEQCQDMLAEKIKPYLAATENPIVTVRMSSYRVTVIGEVGGPKVVPVTTEKMSIIEALASAGDLTIYGKRNNVMLIREDANGEKSVHRLNLNNAAIFSSPYYYLQQNDIIYVEPNSVKTVNSSVGASTTLWFSFIGIAASLAAMIVNIVK
jgi:polysaccharide export outer membrane protein